MIADSNDKIEWLADEFIDRLGTRLGSINLVDLAQYAERVWIHLTAWVYPSAVCLEGSLASLSQEKFGQNAARGISGA